MGKHTSFSLIFSLTFALIGIVGCVYSGSTPVETNVSSAFDPVVSWSTATSSDLASNDAAIAASDAQIMPASTTTNLVVNSSQNSAVVATGTALPSAPPEPKWKLAVPSSFDLLKPDALQSKVQGITFTVHEIVIRGEEIVVFFSVGADAAVKVIPKTARLKVSARDQASQPTSTDFKGTPKYPIMILGQLDNVVLGAVTFDMSDNRLPLLSLEVDSMFVQNEKGRQSEVEGKWFIPLLEDNAPNRPTSLASQIMMTRPYGVVYDKIKIFEGSPQGIDTGFGGRPDITDGIYRFFVFTMESPKEQHLVYAFLMNDGSVKKATQKDYLAKLELFNTPPTPISPAPNKGYDAQETPEPAPTGTPFQRSFEELLKEVNTP